MKKIPAGLEELSGVTQWICFAKDWNEGRRHYSKLPYSALSLKASGWQKTLSDFETASGRIGQAIPGAQIHTKTLGIQPAKVDGVGFVFQGSDYIGIDLDHIYNGISGSMTPEASEIVRLCASYTEVSPSGDGLHIIIRADNAPDFSKWDTRKSGGKPDLLSITGLSAEPPKGEYQIIDTGYMTVTGQAHIRSQPLRALSASDWERLRQYFTRPAKAGPGQNAPSVTSSKPAPATPQAVSGDGSLTQSERLSRWQALVPSLSDEALRAGIFDSGSLGSKVQSLYDGNWAGYPSQSEADYALMGYLLGFVQNAQTACRLFWSSKLWNEDRLKRKGKDYPEKMARKVSASGVMAYAGHIEFNKADKRAYAQGHEAPLDWGDSISAEEEPAESPSVTSSEKAQPSGAQAGAQAEPQDIARGLKPAEPAFDWECFSGAHFDPDEDSIPEGYPIPTGITGLDEVLAGGIYPALYVIGAISSLGKTSLAVQLADTVARGGRPVLYFSLEMSRRELRAKSISRLMYTGAANSRQVQSWSAYTATEILFPSTRHKDNAPTAEDLPARLEAAKKDYSEHEGRNIYYLTGIGTIKAAKIAELTNDFIKSHPDRLRPLVIVDYLQILAAEDPHDTDKTRTDKAVVALKRLSAKAKIPLIVISSFNRENYSAPVSEAAFKESGAVEYSADVLIGLQPNGMKPVISNRETYYNMCCCAECKSEPNIRHLEAKVLKSRVGVPGKAAKLEYRPGYNIFRDENPGYSYKPKDAQVIAWETGQGTGGPRGNKGRKGGKGQAMNYDSKISKDPKDDSAEPGSDDNPF